MKIKTKLTSFACFLALVPLVIATVTLAWISIDSSNRALEDEARRKLMSIRDARKSQIEDYFGTIVGQAKTFSNDRMIIGAARQLNTAFHDSASEQSVDLLRSELASYYRNDVGREYKNKNAGQSIDTLKLLSQLDDESVIMQYHYIKANQHPLGEKHKLNDSSDGSEYSALHKKFHPHIRAYLEEFEYYDIFIADPNTGDIVYSVYKELDFSTSLINGPYASSGIGEVFRLANKANDPESVSLVDFKPYTPSYEATASFIASPIFDGDEKVGILIFQMPIGKINAIMTSNRRWAEVGLGESGETYLVGNDFKARSESRFLIEDQASFLSLIKTAGTAEDIIRKIEAKGSNIGLQRIETSGSREAIAGNSGFAIFPDYRGVSILSAYTPLKIANLNWALMSEIDEEEAFRAGRELTEDVFLVALIMFIVIAIVAILVGLIFANYLTRPIILLSEVMSEVSSNNDLTLRSSVDSDDELGLMSKAFNLMLKKFDGLIQEVSGATVQLAAAAEELSAVTVQTSAGVNRQYLETDQLATAMNEMTATVHEVARSTANAAVAAEETDKQAVTGRQVVEQTSDAISILVDNLSHTEIVINDLNQRSEQIGSVLEVIKSVADQTNLLALNAAIEAARAGEQGRGFAVVADEVRTLAKRTQSSTDEIQEIIQGLQSGAGEAVISMGKNREHAATSIEKVTLARGSLEAITKAINEISDMNIQIASASEEQSSTTEEINRNVSNIGQISAETLEGAEQTTASSAELARLGEQLRNLIGKFKIE